MSLGHDDESGENSSAHMISPGSIAYAIPMHKPSLSMQGRTEYPPPPLSLESSPVVPLTDDALLERWEDPSMVYGVPTTDEKQTELGDVLSQLHPDPSPRNDHNREPESHPWSAHPYANPLASASPVPSSPPPPPPPTASASVRETWGDDNDDGDRAVSEEYAFGSRRGLTMRARMDRAGNVYGSVGDRSRDDEIGTEYVRHTDAGTVRVVELPPLYNDLQR